MRRALFAIGLALLTACGSTEPSNRFDGDYILQTVNGKALPAVFQTSPGNSTTFHNGHYVVLQGGTWFSRDSTTAVVNGQARNSSGGEIGDWVRSGSEVTFIVNNFTSTPSFIHATWAGNALTFAGNYTFVYRRD